MLWPILEVLSGAGYQMVRCDKRDGRFPNLASKAWEPNIAKQRPCWPQLLWRALRHQDQLRPKLQYCGTIRAGDAGAAAPRPSLNVQFQLRQAGHNSRTHGIRGSAGIEFVVVKGQGFGCGVGAAPVVNCAHGQIVMQSRIMFRRSKQPNQPESHFLLALVLRSEE